MLNTYDDVPSEFMKWFPTAEAIIRSTGTAEAIIVKFKTFHLRICDDGRTSSYLVQLYRYYDDIPTKVECVPYNRMHEYASQFK